MRLSEMRPCAVCDQPIKKVFYVVRISQAMITPKAQEVIGTMMAMGVGLESATVGQLKIAEEMAPDPECICVFGEEEPKLMTKILICQDCAINKEVNFPRLEEKVNAQAQEIGSVDK